MTEQEWLTSDDPIAMLHHASMLSDRKYRLFACAVSRLIGPSDDTIDIAERMADGETIHELPEPGRDEILNNAYYAASSAAAIGWGCPLADVIRNNRLQPVKADLLRSIAGNPWKKVTVDPSWVTPDVLTLARSAYEVRVEQLPADQLYTESAARGITNYTCMICGYVASSLLRENHRKFCQGLGMIDQTTLNVMVDALKEAGIPQEVDCTACRGRGFFDDETDMDWPCRACSETGKVQHPIIEALLSRVPKYRGFWPIDLFLRRH